MKEFLQFVCLKTSRSLIKLDKAENVNNNQKYRTRIECIDFTLLQFVKLIYRKLINNCKELVN